MVVEGVPYLRYRVRYVMTDGRRRAKVLYCPGDAWIEDTVRRWIEHADVDVRAGSNVRISRAT